MLNRNIKHEGKFFAKDLTCRKLRTNLFFHLYRNKRKKKNFHRKFQTFKQRKKKKFKSPSLSRQIYFKILFCLRGNKNTKRKEFLQKIWKRFSSHPFLPFFPPCFAASTYKIKLEESSHELLENYRTQISSPSTKPEFKTKFKVDVQ